MLALHGPDFVRGARTVAMLTFGHVVNASFGLAGWVLLASGRSKTVLANNLGALAVNIALCVFLVPRFGIEGAAMSATLAVIVLHVVQSIEAWVIARAHPLSAGFVRLCVAGHARHRLRARARSRARRQRSGSRHRAGGRAARWCSWRSPGLIASTAERDVLRAMLRLKPRRG